MYKEKLLCESMKPGGFEDNVLMGAKYISMLVQSVSAIHVRSSQLAVYFYVLTI